MWEDDGCILKPVDTAMIGKLFIQPGEELRMSTTLDLFNSLNKSEMWFTGLESVFRAFRLNLKQNRSA